MKKTLLILMTVLFSFGAFSSSSYAVNENNLNPKEVVSSFETSELILKKDKCVVKVTTTITIDHGEWSDVITIVRYEDC